MNAPPPSQIVNVALGERSYEIAIVTGELPDFAEKLTGWLARRGLKAGVRPAVLIATDSHV